MKTFTTTSGSKYILDEDASTLTRLNEQPLAHHPDAPVVFNVVKVRRLEVGPPAVFLVDIDGDPEQLVTTRVIEVK